MATNHATPEEVARIRCARCGMRAENGRCLARCERWPEPDELAPVGRPARAAALVGETPTPPSPAPTPTPPRPPAAPDREPRFGPGWVAARVRRGEPVSREICETELGPRLGAMAWESDWPRLLEAAR